MVMIATLECVIGICLLANRVMPPGTVVDPEGKARIVLDSVSDEGLISATCERNRISEADFYAWRETTLAAAAELRDRADPL